MSDRLEHGLPLTDIANRELIRLITGDVAPPPSEDGSGSVTKLLEEIGQDGGWHLDPQFQAPISYEVSRPAIVGATVATAAFVGGALHLLRKRGVK